jgi:single-stranded DNA-binding protein
MNSFTLWAVGELARNPESVPNDDIAVTRFCVVGCDSAGGSDVAVRLAVVTSLWFYAFGDIAVSLLKNARKGDQLIVEARPSAECKIEKDGSRLQEVDFFVTGFRYGAKKGGGFSGADAMSRTPPTTPSEVESIEAAA